MEDQVTQPAGDGQSAVPEGTGQGTGPATEGTGTGTGEAGAQSGAEGTPPESQSTEEEKVPKSQHEQLRNQLAAADRKRQEAETELQKIRDKDLPELERMKRDLTSATARAEKAEAELRTERIANAFFRDNTYKWHDAAAALKMVDLSEVHIADDGTITGMKEALKRLATGNAWMIDKAGSGSEGGSGGTPPAGAPNMNGSAGSNTDAGAKALTGRLSAMRTRRRPVAPS